jgi:hypothetical protein
MVGKCINPFCGRPSLHSNGGKTFVVEFPLGAADSTSPHSTWREEFWLCGDCARGMTVSLRRDPDLNRISIRIINLPECGATKLKFVSPAAAAFQELAYFG